MKQKQPGDVTIKPCILQMKNKQKTELLCIYTSMAVMQ